MHTEYSRNVPGGRLSLLAAGLALIVAFTTDAPQASSVQVDQITGEAVANVAAKIAQGVSEGS